jgi:hypothetical protein
LKTIPVFYLATRGADRLAIEVIISAVRHAASLPL